MSPQSVVPRWVPRLLAVVAIALIPWTLWLTFTLPSRHVADDYDLAWVGFDIALAVAIGATAWMIVRGSHWLVPVAAVAGTMLVCDAWFDITTSSGSTERTVAILEATLAELPLAAICGWIVYDVERFSATVDRIRRPTTAARRAAARAMAEDERS
ncbi:MAG TPA: hypothetical protein VGP54_09770 [Gaiellaceae bacterium]|jgi:hypothetical protein|nr:hypothetical protein [Gaiellaceae bacterium]